MSANQKNMKPSEVNDAFLSDQDMVSYKDSDTGTQKVASKDAAGGVTTSNLLGVVQAAVKGSVSLVAGEINVNLGVHGQPIVSLSFEVKIARANQGFKAVEITIPGGDGVTASMAKITSSNVLDDDEISYIGFIEQL